MLKKNTSFQNPLFRYNVAIGDKLQPTISVNESKWEEEDKIEEEPKITISIYDSGGKKSRTIYKMFIFKITNYTRG